jgi:hypothetical protein
MVSLSDKHCHLFGNVKEITFMYGTANTVRMHLNDPYRLTMRERPTGMIRA